MFASNFIQNNRRVLTGLAAFIGLVALATLTGPAAATAGGALLVLFLAVALTRSVRGPGEAPPFLRLAHALTTWVLLLAVAFTTISGARYLADSGDTVGSDGLTISRSALTLSGAGTLAVGGTLEPEIQREVEAQYGPAAELAANNNVTVRADDPSAGLMALAWARLLASVGLALGALFLVRRLFEQAMAGTPFSDASVRILRGLAGVAFAYWAAVEVTRGWLTGLIVESAGGTGGFEATLNLWPLLAAVAALALAEVWRHGIALQRDVESTI